MTKHSPEQSIGFLIYEVSRLIRKDFDKRVHALGLTQIQWRALAHIVRMEGCNQATLAEVLEIKPITLTRLIDRLQAAGLLERRPDPQDRRAVKLHLTEKCRPLIAVMQEKGMQTKAIALEGIEEEDRNTLLRILKHMKENLNT
jgi:MarR family transcriptional regulator, transcriptional regulator for hemolysin